MPDITGALQARETMITRLREDLIGPRSADETITSRPSDVYLTGVLWPRNTAVAPEEDERLAVAPEGGEGSDDAEDQAQPRAVGMRRPSTAGVSFAAYGESGQPSVRVRLRFGTYADVESEKKIVWKRTAHAPEDVIVVLGESPANIPVVSGTLAGLRLNVRTAQFFAGTLATITLVNDMTPEERDRASSEKTSLFQVSLEILPDEGTKLIARPSRRAPVDDDDWSSALLYRNAREFAVGHTCSAGWDEPVPDTGHSARVYSTWIPEATVQAVSPDGDTVFEKLADGAADPLSALWLSEADDAALYAGLQKLCEAYGRWIAAREEDIRGLPNLLQDAARRHIREARSVLARMKAGADFIRDSAPAREAFRLANVAMHTQRLWAGSKPLRWRPFQLGFILLTLESTAKGDHPDREKMDLLWFPTGGGKTEAYLGLIAFVAFHRRLSRDNPDEGAGLSTIMRYTLRLLTTQQFMRAAAMICACEAIRRGTIALGPRRKLGREPIGIGLWVGSEATPNSRQKAFDSVSDTRLSSPRQLTRCPCCNARLDYVQKLPTDPVSVICATETCALFGAPLPIWTVDEDVYAFRPTLLIGTIDKFAQIATQANTAALFGVGTKAQAQLILQDELHLISGPLGTLAGLYESALDLILSAGGTRPKIIGSTATIRRAPDQVLALFDRTTCQFPPPGIDAADSGFTVVRPDLPGRRYVGVTTAGRSAKFTLQAVSASLLQSALHGLPQAQRDNYWTLVAYFNSLRELGGALVLVQDDVHDTLRLIARARGEDVRNPRAVQELTSRRSQAEIREMLDLLDLKAGNEAALDVVLATNMISVGVDISRLGLMLVNGQPKTIAEYIQSTSRVGRGDVPGLVVPILNNGKPRDRSHYETFGTWHTTLYREVEATSVTPFASRARDRALHAVLVSIIRHLVPDRLRSPVLDDPSIARAEDLITEVAARARRVDLFEIDVETELRERLRRWIRRAPQQYMSKFPATSLLQSAERAAALHASGRSIGQAWPTLSSMRGVEPATNYRLVEGLRKDP